MSSLKHHCSTILPADKTNACKKKNPTNSCQMRDHDMYNIFSNLFSIIRMCGHDMYNIFPIYLGLIRIRAHDMYSFSNLFSIIHVQGHDILAIFLILYACRVMICTITICLGLIGMTLRDMCISYV